MINRERFMLDVDSEGFPIPNHAPFHEVLAAQRIGRVPDTLMAQAMLADTRCLQCPPTEQCPRSGYCEHRNPEGWREVDGVKLPAITWAEPNLGDIGAKGDLLRSMQDCANINHDGITRLSDSYAPDAFFGWRR